MYFNSKFLKNNTTLLFLTEGVGGVICPFKSIFGDINLPPPLLVNYYPPLKYFGEHESIYQYKAIWSLQYP